MPHSDGHTRAAFDLYTTIPWATRCAAVASFRPVPPTNYGELAKWILAETGCYGRCYVAQQVLEISGEKWMEAPGVEAGVGDGGLVAAGAGGVGRGELGGGGGVGSAGVGSVGQGEVATLARIALERLERGDVEAVAALLRVLAR